MASFYEKLKRGEENELIKERKEEKKFTPTRRVSRAKKIKVNLKKEVSIGQREIKEKKWFDPARQSLDWQNLGGPEGELAIDFYQAGEEFVIQAAIAGVKPGDFDISIEKDVVTIKGKREKPEEREKMDYFHQECYWGPFSRKIILPEEGDPSKAQATMREGILTIRIPKVEKEKKKKVVVNPVRKGGV